MSNKRKKKYTSGETLQILSDHGKFDYVTSYDAQETKAFNGDIVFDASRGGSKYRLPLHLMMFGDLTYDDTSEILDVVMPKTLVCSGDLIIKSKRHLQVGQNYSLRARAKNAVIDFMGSDSSLSIRELLITDTIIIKNYTGSSFPLINMYANHVVFVNCPKLGGIDRDYLKNKPTINAENCPCLLDSDGSLIDSNIDVDVDNISEFANKSELVALDSISVDLEGKHQTPDSFKCRVLKVSNSILPERVNATATVSNISSMIKITNSKSVSGSTVLKVGLDNSNSNITRCDKIDISCSDISSIETNITKVTEFIANNAKLVTIPDSIQKIYKLNVRNTPISKLSDSLKVNDLDIFGTKITYLPNIFSESGCVSIYADFDKLDNAICRTLPFTDDQRKLVMFMHDGKFFLSVPHRTHNNRYFYELNEYLKLLYSDSEHYPADLIRFMEMHLSEVKMELKRKLRKLKCSKDVLLMNID